MKKKPFNKAIVTFHNQDIFKKEVAKFAKICEAVGIKIYDTNVEQNEDKLTYIFHFEKDYETIMVMLKRMENRNIIDKYELSW